jgi:fructose-bisphosphate aldolase class I
VFLSGGQSPDEATSNLNEIIKRKGEVPWNLSFSFARALQGEALETWRGDSVNTLAAQKALLERLEKVSKARNGQL